VNRFETVFRRSVTLERADGNLIVLPKTFMVNDILLSNMHCTTRVFACISTVLYSCPLPNTPRESSNLKTETGYPVVGKSVVVY